MSIGLSNKSPNTKDRSKQQDYSYSLISDIQSDRSKDFTPDPSLNNLLNNQDQQSIFMLQSRKPDVNTRFNSIPRGRPILKKISGVNGNGGGGQGGNQGDIEPEFPGKSKLLQAKKNNNEPVANNYVIEEGIMNEYGGNNSKGSPQNNVNEVNSASVGGGGGGGKQKNHVQFNQGNENLIPQAMTKPKDRSLDKKHSNESLRKASNISPSTKHKEFPNNNPHFPLVKLNDMLVNLDKGNNNNNNKETSSVTKANKVLLRDNNNRILSEAKNLPSGDKDESSFLEKFSKKNEAYLHKNKRNIENALKQILQVKHNQNHMHNEALSDRHLNDAISRLNKHNNSILINQVHSITGSDLLDSDRHMTQDQRGKNKFPAINPNATFMTNSKDESFIFEKVIATEKTKEKSSSPKKSIMKTRDSSKNKKPLITNRFVVMNNQSPEQKNSGKMLKNNVYEGDQISIITNNSIDHTLDTRMNSVSTPIDSESQIELSQVDKDDLWRRLDFKTKQQQQDVENDKLFEIELQRIENLMQKNEHAYADLINVKEDLLKLYIKEDLNRYYSKKKTQANVNNL